jgi:hypothetical protein
MLTLLVAAGLAAVQSPASPGSSQLQKSAPQSAAPVSDQTAKALARTVAPADLLLPVEIEQARKALLSLPTLDPDAKELESEYPGIWAAVWTASEPELRRSVEAGYPKLWSSLEQLYRARLTEDEADAILTFYRSDTGQRMLQGMVESLDGASVFAEVVKSPDSPMTPEQMRTMTEAAGAGAAKRLKSGDSVQFLQLMHYVDLDKFKLLGAETQKVTLDWVNAEDPEGDARLQAIMEEAMQDYMAAPANQ